MPEVYARAHYLWYAYVGVGLTSLIAMLVFIAVTRKMDAGKGFLGWSDIDADGYYHNGWLVK